MKRYEHTQTGYLMIVALTAALILVGTILASAGIDWISVGVMVVVGIALVLFSSLTVTIREDDLEIRFGPGQLRRKFKLREIQSCRVVKSPFFYGWGVRLTPHGWLYNVSGFHGVEISFSDGKKVRIGTDVPQELEKAINQAIRTSPRL